MDHLCRSHVRSEAINDFNRDTTVTLSSAESLRPHVTVIITLQNQNTQMKIQEHHSKISHTTKALALASVAVNEWMCAIETFTWPHFMWSGLSRSNRKSELRTHMFISDSLWLFSIFDVASFVHSYYSRPHCRIHLQAGLWVRVRAACLQCSVTLNAWLASHANTHKATIKVIVFNWESTAATQQTAENSVSVVICQASVEHLLGTRTVFRCFATQFISFNFWNKIKEDFKFFVMW